MVPAVVVLLGGGKLKGGEGIMSDKITKIPSKRAPQALRVLLTDYEENSTDGEYFHDYFKRLGRNYFYQLIKRFADMTTVAPDEYIDWGQDRNFVLHTAVGECAGVIIDLISTLLADSEDKLKWAKETYDNKQYADSIYHSYSAFINTAKSLLLSRDIKPSTQIQTLNDFQKVFVDTRIFEYQGNFKEYVLSINKNEPSASFALSFLAESVKFLDEVVAYRSTAKEVMEK
jgi:sulfite reductase (ferredoxin)